MEEGSIEDGERIGQETEVAPALIAIHPLEKSVVVAVGSELRIFDLQGDRSITLLGDDSGGPLHTDAIRAVCFGANGRVFASAGDDKLVKIWNTESWQCTRTVSSEKRVSAVAISHNGSFLTFADKFGVVWVVDLERDDEKAAPLLAHYCSIITSLDFSPDGQFIASADRDFKIRITVFPKKPLDGAHEIQSFCLGHTDFVSCLAFVHTLEYPQGFLLSGSGDSTVRLWDFISGTLLDTCEVGAQAELVESNGEECPPVVTDICASSDGSLVAVAIQSLHGVMLMCCNFSAGTLSVSKRVALGMQRFIHPYETFCQSKALYLAAPPKSHQTIMTVPSITSESQETVVTVGESFVPTRLGLSCSAEHLWMVTGASNLPSSGPLAHVRVVSLCQKGLDPTVLEDGAVPGGKKLLEKLQGSSTVVKQGDALVAAAEAVKMAMRNLLIKREYSTEKRELRKKSRNDRKLKQIL